MRKLLNTGALLAAYLFLPLSLSAISANDSLNSDDLLINRPLEAKHRHHHSSSHKKHHSHSHKHHSHHSSSSARDLNAELKNIVFSAFAFGVDDDIYDNNFADYYNYWTQHLVIPSIYFDYDSLTNPQAGISFQIPNDYLPTENAYVNVQFFTGYDEGLFPIGSVQLDLAASIALPQGGVISATPSLTTTATVAGVTNNGDATGNSLNYYSAIFNVTGWFQAGEIVYLNIGRDNTIAGNFADYIYFTSATVSYNNQ